MNSMAGDTGGRRSPRTSDIGRVCGKLGVPTIVGTAKAILGFIVGAAVTGVVAVVLVFVLVSMTIVPTEMGTTIVVIAAILGGIGFAWYVVQ